MKQGFKPDVIGSEGWFYSETVKDHFFNPRNIFKTKEEAKKYRADGIGTVGSPACLSGEAIVHTDSGLRKIEEIRVNKKIIGHTGKQYAVEKTFARNYRGELITIRNQFGKVSLTPEHLVLAIKKPLERKFDYTENKKNLYSAWFHASHLVKGDIFLYPVPREIKQIETIEIPQEKAKYDFRSASLPKQIKITPELMEFFGYFIAEGYTKKQETGFSFSIREKHLAGRVKEITKKIFNLESKIKEKPEKNSLYVSVYSIHLSKWLATVFGKGAENKKIPDFLLFLEPSLQQHLIKGLWLGDGYINLTRTNPRAGYATTSNLLAHQIKILLLRQKTGVSIYEEKEKTIRGVKHKKNYRLHIGELESLEKICKILGVGFNKKSLNRRIAEHSWFDEHYYYAPIRKVTASNFTGDVYNLEVEKAHSFVTENLTVHNCGDVMKLWIKVDKKTDRIKECKFQTFGCASAIASTSMLTVMATEKGGMKLDNALKLAPRDIMERLGGLPERKIHCSVLGDKALREAINDYFRKSRQFGRIKEEGAKIIDKALKITNKDIEEAVLEGARTFEDVQKRTKVGVQDKNCIPEVKKLIKYYREKHFGK